MVKLSVGRIQFVTFIGLQFYRKLYIYFIKVVDILDMICYNICDTIIIGENYCEMSEMRQKNETIHLRKVRV